MERDVVAMHQISPKEAKTTTINLPTLSGRFEGSSHVMKNGLGALPGSWNRDIVATRHVR
jgi:hypothetical protein